MRTSAIFVVPLAAAVLSFPAWWAAGRLHDEEASPFFRFLTALGLALVAYVATVNYAGRLAANSFAGVGACLALHAAAGAWIARTRPREEWRARGLLASWRSWLPAVALAVALGVPQWVLAVSSNYWDESTTSAIHLTAPNQFAEGIFPPRHNALPDLPVKYHYGFAILSGTVRLATGMTANHAIDVVSTALWLFVFLFVAFWFRELGFDAVEAAWGAFAALLGGGLAWLYLPRIESYDGIEKVPPLSALTHKWEPAKSWLQNLLGAALVPSQHLRNADGTLSALSWDVAAQFQQHAVSLGIAMTVVALFLFAKWRARGGGRGPLYFACAAAFGALFLGHAVFGTVAAVAAGSVLLLDWLRRPTRALFADGLAFGAGVSALALLHGGMLVGGARYGGGGFTTMRRVLGYSSGGFAGFLHWNLASFGIPLVLAVVALLLHGRRRDEGSAERRELFAVLSVFALFSYAVPQAMFYSSETYGVEQYTEISKFFFAARFAFALLSAFGAASLRSKRRAWAAAAVFAASAVSPVAYCWANSVDAKGAWLGFYTTPYHRASIEEQMGTALGRLKKSGRDVYFDASADERKSGYLSEMLAYGGSLFTLTPSAYERTGVGFRIAQDVVARRFTQNGRAARLLPGALEAASVSWVYSRPLSDWYAAPAVVRARFERMLAEGILTLKSAAGLRALYAVEKPTAGIDDGIERWWKPNVVAQTVADCDGDGKGDLIFYDYRDKKILCGKTTIALPEQAKAEFVDLRTARFPGNAKSCFLLGRMKDTTFALGRSIDDVDEHDGWAWTYRDASGAPWQPEYERWLWDVDVPLVADIDGSGYARHLAYRRPTGTWLLAPDKTLPGPKADEKMLPVPFAGRFLEGSRGDLGVWSLLDGKATITTIATGKTTTLRWGGTYGFTLVSGDYDGVGHDELAIYNAAERTWYWGPSVGGPLSNAKFGTKTGVPLPWDYDHDGRLDLAYWEPAQGKIFVSFDRGRTVGKTIAVPPHSLPAFVNMY